MLIEDDSEHDSDDNAKLVIECSTPKRKLPPEPTQYEKKIIASIEDELERRLEEKALKSNLNQVQVRQIIKQIVTNRNVLALIRRAEDPNCEEDYEPEYEPTLTRSKAKELLASTSHLACSPSKKSPKSGVEVLLTEDLPEDESGEDEEYVPHEELDTDKDAEIDESEDDRDSSVCSSNPPSVPPPTTPTRGKDLGEEKNSEEDSEEEEESEETELSIDDSFLEKADHTPRKSNEIGSNEGRSEVLKTPPSVGVIKSPEIAGKYPGFASVVQLLRGNAPETISKSPSNTDKELLGKDSTEFQLAKNQPSEIQLLLQRPIHDDTDGEDDDYEPARKVARKEKSTTDVHSPCSPHKSFLELSSLDLSSKSVAEASVTWSEDGVFKMPLPKTAEPQEDANIARRTRSKLSLTSTPLEKIEQAFIPPDITTDMYDTECENEDWAEFLKTFTKPLDEIVKAPEEEEEEHDPEYNILADEDLQELDLEDWWMELRRDKAVKISKKELNNLISELFEYTEKYCTKIDRREEEERAPPQSDNSTQDIVIEVNQYLLLQQQMRQHIQMLLQNYVLLYGHPEFSELAPQLKEYLYNFKFLSEGKEHSAFKAMNLDGALKFIDDWEAVYNADGEDVVKMKKHIDKTLTTSIERKRTGSEYIPQHAPFMLEKLSKCDVLLYSSLLPKIPFKSSAVTTRTTATTTPAEDGLIAFHLQQFFEIFRLKRSNRKHLKEVCDLISKYGMNFKTGTDIMKLVVSRKNSRSASNPIQFYYKNGKCMPIIQRIMPLDEVHVVPPCQRSAEELPYQWKGCAQSSNETLTVSNAAAQKNTYVASIPVINVIQQNPTLNSPGESVSNTSVAPHTLSYTAIPIIQIIPQIADKNHQQIQQSNNILPSNVNCTQIVSSVSEISYQYVDRAIQPKGGTPLITITKKKKQKVRKKQKHSILNPFKNFVKCLTKPSNITKVSKLLNHNPFEQLDSDIISVQEQESGKYKILRKTPEVKSVQSQDTEDNCDKCSGDCTKLTMLPNMPTLGTPIKSGPNQVQNSQESSTTNYPILVETAKEKESTEKNEATNETEKNNIDIDSSSSVGDSVEISCDDVYQPTPFVFKTEPEAEKDDLNEINALLVASTAKPTIRKEPSGAEKKKAKMRREFLANLVVSTPEDPQVQKKKNEMFALAYYDKMRETLELDDYHKVMQILNEYEEGDAVDLYLKIEKILRPKYVELADEFLLFLREREAAAVSQLIPWIRMNNRSKFLRKLEIYFKDQPAQLRKIYKCLTELSQDANVSIERIKTTLLPMFKGNAVLTDLFLQNFMNEQPPPSLLEGPYEIIDLEKKSTIAIDDEIYETVKIPQVEDKYGGPSCICTCHNIEDPEFKSRFRHCIRCGTKFVKGKVFIQTGRGLKPATISFLNNPEVDHRTRLVASSSKPAAQTRTAKRRQRILTPRKNLEEDSDDEVDGQKRKKKPARKRKTTESSSKKSKTTDSVNDPNLTDVNKDKTESSPSKNGRKKVYKKQTSPSKRTKKAKISTDDNDKYKVEIANEEMKIEESLEIEESNIEQIKMLHEEISECEENVASTDPEHEVLKANSPELQTAESESECFEECSSQDNCESDSNSSTSSCNNLSQSDSNAGDEESWTRGEDRLILETFKNENHKERAFQMIAQKMSHRTISQIRHRFDTLMGILMQTMIGHS